MSAGELAMNLHGLKRAERLQRQRDYEAVYDARQSAADEHLLVYVRGNGLDFSRMGRSVSGKWGKANVRNRFRRLVSEAFRLNRDRLPKGYDIIVIPRGSIDTTLEEVAESLVAMVSRAAAKRRKPNP